MLFFFLRKKKLGSEIEIACKRYILVVILKAFQAPDYPADCVGLDGGPIQEKSMYFLISGINKNSGLSDLGIYT